MDSLNNIFKILNTFFYFETRAVKITYNFNNSNYVYIIQNFFRKKKF